jgi:hypothetical protein
MPANQQIAFWLRPRPPKGFLEALLKQPLTNAAAADPAREAAAFAARVLPPGG